MVGLEKKFLEEYQFQPSLWLRFLDSVFCRWDHGEEELKAFFSYLNSFYPTIKFIMDYSIKRIAFLDVVLIKTADGSLSTDLFCKSTDTYQLLHSKSCHRNTCKKAIPYGQAICIKHIYSDSVILNQHLMELESWLTNRGYDQSQVRNEIQRVHQIERIDLLRKRDRILDNKITLAFTYHPALNKVYKILEKAHRHVFKLLKLHVVLPSPPRVAIRNAKTLKDILVRSKLKPIIQKQIHGV